MNGEVRTSNRPEAFPALTGLRFLAALCVLLGHATKGLLHFGSGEVRWSVLLWTLPGIGMPLFFVLSGFVIHYNYHRPIVDNPARGVFNFLMARFARLYPLYIVVVCYSLFSGGYFENLSDPGIRSQLYAAIPSYLALVQTWYYRIIDDHTLIFMFPATMQVTWSISTEWFFYFVYPFACIVLARLRRPGPIILAAAVVVAAGYASVYWAAAHQAAIDSYAVEHYGAIAGPGSAEDFQGWLLYISPYPHLFEFALGCLAAALLIAVRDVPVTRWEARLGRCGLIFAIGSIAVLYVTFYEPDAQLSPVFRILAFEYFGFAPFIAVLLFCCTRYRSWVSAALSRPWIVLCGEASYSIYLIHIGVVQYAEQFDQFAGLAKPPYTGWSVLHDVVELVLLTATVIGLSLISYNVIEVPARRWLRRWLNLPARRIAAAPGERRRSAALGQRLVTVEGEPEHRQSAPKTPNAHTVKPFSPNTAAQSVRAEGTPQMKRPSGTGGYLAASVVCIALAIVIVVLVDYVIYPTTTETTGAVAQTPAPNGETAMANLPNLPDTEGWEIIWGLNAKAIDIPPVVSGQTPLQLSAVPTEDSDAQNRHAISLVLTGLNPGGVYRVTSWVKSASTTIQLELHDSVDAQTNEPANEGEVRFNFKTGSTTVPYGNLLAQGIDTTTDGWNKAWVDLKSADGVVYVYLGLLEQGGSSPMFTGEGEQLLLGGIEAAPKP